MEADIHGIENSMHRALDVVLGTVGNMNKQEVNWEQIFTRTVSPALISGIASMFAFAIAQSLQFNNALAQTATSAGLSTDQMGQLGASSEKVAVTTGQSAQDVQKAMTQLGAIFSDSNDQQRIAAVMAQLAASGFGDLSDIVKVSTDIFKQWGVTTSDEAVAVLTELMHGAQGAKESIPALAEQFSRFSAPLHAAGADLNSFNGLISNFAGAIQAGGLENANSQFQVLAKSATSVVGPMELLGFKFHDVQSAIQGGDVLGLLDNTAKKIGAMGASAYLVLPAFGFVNEEIDSFNQRMKQVGTYDKDVNKITFSLNTVDDTFGQTNTAIREFQKAWEEMKVLSIAAMGAIGKEIEKIGTEISPIVSLIKNIGGAFQAVDKEFMDTTVGKFLSGKIKVPYVSEMFGDILDKEKSLVGAVMNPSQALLSVASGAASAINNSLFPSTSKKTDNNIGGIDFGALAMNSSKQDVNRVLGSSGNDFSSDEISKIDKKAEDSDMMEQLLTALKSGVKFGGDSYNFTSTFQLTPEKNSTQLNAQQIAKQLYEKFQGTQ